MRSPVRKYKTRVDMQPIQKHIIASLAARKHTLFSIYFNYSNCRTDESDETTNQYTNVHRTKIRQKKKYQAGFFFPF